MEQDKFGPFYATVCHVCKNTHTEGPFLDTLKTCKGCRLISYCSVGHQQQHWPYHKKFCRTVKKLMKNLKVAHVFQNAVDITSSIGWCELRTKLKMLCEVMLNRSLSTSESEMLYFPRVCLICHKYDPTSLRDCSDCNCVSYCSVEHMNEDAPYHSRTCQALKLCFDLDISATHCTLPVMNLKFGERNNCQSIDNFYDTFMQFALQSNKLSDPLASSLYFTILSCPLTFIESVYKVGLHISQKLVVHLIGSSNFEVQHIEMWDIVFHWLHYLTDLHLILIGPEVSVASELALCSKCEEAGCKITVEYCPGQLYHNYVTSTGFTKPDIIVMFNCGLSEYTGRKEDTWQSSIPCIVSSRCAVVITSYTPKEAENDLNRLMAFSKKMSVLVHCEENKFLAKKPIRDWEQFNSQSETLVFYHNAFISILVPKYV